MVWKRAIRYREDWRRRVWDKDRDATGREKRERKKRGYMHAKEEERNETRRSRSQSSYIGLVVWCRGCMYVRLPTCTYLPGYIGSYCTILYNTVQ
jgi:hypothetical protein